MIYRSSYPLSFLGALGVLTVIAAPRNNPRDWLNLWTWLGVILCVGLAIIIPPLLRSRLPRLSNFAQRYGIRLSLLVVAVGLGIVVSLRYYAFLRLGGDAIGITIRLWFVAITLLIGAVLPAHWPTPRAWLARHRGEVLALAALTGIGAALRFWQLGALPRIINGDEGLIGTWAQDIGRASGILTMPFSAMDGVGTLYLAAMQQFFAVLGPTPFALRLLPAVAGTLAIPATYLFARQILGPRVALIAAALLTFSHVHLHFSRTVAVSYIYATLFVPLALYFLVTGFERRSPLRLVLCILAVGIHINVYIDGWVWLMLIPLILAAWWLIDRTIYAGQHGLLVLLGVATAVIITPMIIWASVFPAEFFARMTVDGTVASGWLSREADLTGKPQIVLLAELLLAALGTFTHLPFIDFYGVGVPTLDPLSATLGVIGVVIALWRTWDRKIVVLNGWFWAGVVALGPTTVPPSTYHYRLLVALPAALILCALAVDVLLTYVMHLLDRLQRPAWSAGPGTRALVAVGTLLLIAALNVRIYYGSFLGNCRYESIQTRQAGMLGNYLSGLATSPTVYILPSADSFRAGPYLSLDFLSNRIPITNLDEPLTRGRPPELEHPLSGDLLVAVAPERSAELDQLRQWFPSGRWTARFDCGREALYLFEWQPAMR